MGEFMHIDLEEAIGHARRSDEAFDRRQEALEREQELRNTLMRPNGKLPLRRSKRNQIREAHRQSFRGETDFRISCCIARAALDMAGLPQPELQEDQKQECELEQAD